MGNIVSASRFGAPVVRGTLPEYITGGGIQSVGSPATISITYPTEILENDILIVQFGSDQESRLQVGATGFTEIYFREVVHSHQLLWKRADGTETGSETFNITQVDVPTVQTGRMTNWRNCKETGTPWENLAQRGSSGSPMDLTTNWANSSPSTVEKLGVALLL